MKILQIHTSMSGGGIQSVVCSLANELSRIGEEVTVCSISQPEPSDVFWNKLATNVKKITLGKRGGGFSIGILFKIAYLFVKEKYDVIQIHGFFCYYSIAILLLHRRFKFFYTVHSDASMENGKWDQRFIYLKKFCFKRGWLHPITISDASKYSFSKLYNCESTLIYNGIPRPAIPKNCGDVSKLYRYTPETRVFVHVGRIDTPKNQVVLCNVFKRLIEEGNDIVLLIVGGITSRSILNKIKPFFSNRIVYLGERNDVPILMYNSDAMCLPSIWEGLPMVLLEAMSVGCVPICSPVGGITDVITNGRNGILSKSSNEDDYYNAVKSFLNMPKKVKVFLKQHAISDYELYTVDKMASLYLKVYKKVK